MYNPTLRLLTILELLQARDEVTGAELAQRLEVDGRSVRRYMAMLQDLGIPVESVRGRYGGYRLRPGYTLPPLMFTNEEAVAVIVGLLTLRTQGVTFATPSVIGATAKIQRVLPATLRDRIHALQQVASFGAPAAPTALTIDGDTILHLADAVYRRHQVAIRYRSEPGEDTERCVDPYGVACWAGRWYMVGYCHLRAGIRAFRVDRVREVIVQSTTYDPPSDFDCMDYLAHAFGRFVHTWAVEVVLKTTLEDAQAKIPPLYGEVEAIPDGVRYRCHVANMADTARFLVDLRVPFVVVAPDELRTALRELAAEIGGYAEGRHQAP